MTTLAAPQTSRDQALAALRQSGNPFRNYFARNPDDEVCARYHVAELYAREREQLLAVVDLYRHDAKMHAEVVPILGNKGAGKTHLLHSIKHGEGPHWQLLVTPGTYTKGADFLEYVLFQVIDALLGGTKQRGQRPLEVVGDELTRKLLHDALQNLDASQRADLFPLPGIAGWMRRLGMGNAQAEERLQWLIDVLARPGGMTVRRACSEANLDPLKARDVIYQFIERSETRSAAGQMRRHIYQGFVLATLLGDESELANFLTNGFAELDFNVRPSRQDLVLALSKVLMEVLLELHVPVVVAFDQLEDLLLVRRTEDGHKVSEAFFAGIVQVMHQVSGVCFLIFAERGLWNRFVPSLDGYVQDRLNNPVHVPGYGTIKALRLEAPPAQLVWQVVAARMRPALAELPDASDLSPIFPFTDDQVARIARTEPTLRDMLQQFRHLFDHVVYGNGTDAQAWESPPQSLPLPSKTNSLPLPSGERVGVRGQPASVPDPTAYVEKEPVGEIPASVKNVTIVEATTQRNPLRDLPDPRKWEMTPAAATPAPRPATPKAADTPLDLLALAWDQQFAAARQQLEPEGALTGATRQVQSGLGRLLQLSHEHGVKCDGWRLQHVVPEYAFGQHPTYGIMTLAHWARENSPPRRVGIGLFLGRGPGKPKDLQVKLTAFEGEPPVLDQLVLLRPVDDATLSGKSKSLFEEAVACGKLVRLEAIGLEDLTRLYAFPRWLKAVKESLPEGQPLPNLADFLQSRCEQLLQQFCTPRVTG